MSKNFAFYSTFWSDINMREQEYEMLEIEDEDSATSASKENIREEVERDSTLSIIPTSDNPDAPALTIRVIILGTFWCIVLGLSNSILAFRTNTFEIPTFVATLISYPLGILLHKTLPQKKVHILGLGIDLNPGPFGIKEHVLITIIAGGGT